MTKNKHEFKIDVTSEIGDLRCLLIHSPDSGLGKVVPSKAQDWLFEDIVHLDTMRRNEYDYYVKLLMYFLDPEKIKGKLSQIDSDESDRAFFKPDNANFHASHKVIELQSLLADILEESDIRKKLVASVCAIENCTYRLQQKLIDTPPVELAKVFISGSLGNDEMIFAPIPNLIFSRDIGIAINNYMLLNKPAKKARSRETLLARYIFFNHPLFAAYQENIL
jgi:arginine deiminase